MFLIFCSNKYAAEEHSFSEIARVSAQMDNQLDGDEDVPLPVGA